MAQYKRHDGEQLSMSFYMKSLSVIQRLLWLRSGAIAIQFITVIAVYFVLSVDIHLTILLSVIAVESLFHGASILYYRRRQAGHVALFSQVIADVIFLTILLSFSGGATNAFVSLLLLPIVIGAVSLPLNLAGAISIASVAAYSGLLFILPNENAHHMDMTNHFIGMWINFLLSVIVVTLVVGTMARLIREREQSLAKARERHLRDEQLLSLGVASAQVTHQLATPLTNLQLLHDELMEEHPQEQAVIAMEHPLEQCRHQLGYFRTLATSIRENTQQSLSVATLLDEIKTIVKQEFEQTLLVVNTDSAVGYLQRCVVSDAMLLPALTNLIDNGVKSNSKTDNHRIELVVKVSDKELELAFKDFGTGLVTQQNIGETLVRSEQGFGMAMLLSNITLERLGGSLTLTNHSLQGAVAHVTLPLCQIEQRP